MSDIKVCTKCKQEKPLSRFYQRKNRKSPRSHCIECINAYAKEYNRTHRERRAIIAKRYVETHREQVREQCKRYYRNNPEKKAAASRAYYLKHKERLAAKGKERRLKLKLQEFMNHGEPRGADERA